MLLKTFTTRDEIKKDTDIGKQIINDMNDGKFVSDEIVNTIIKKFIFDPQKKNKLISYIIKWKLIGTGYLNWYTTMSLVYTSCHKLSCWLRKE